MATHSASTLGDRSSAIIQNAFGFYVQDNFKVRPNLTLELGLALRLEHDSNRALRPVRRFRSGNAIAGAVGSGIDKVYEENNKNFQPRVGIAWDPFNDGKTSVRAAYAILTDQPVTNVVTPLTSNPPLATPLTFTGPDYFRECSARPLVWPGLAPNTRRSELRQRLRSIVEPEHST